LKAALSSLSCFRTLVESGIALESNISFSLPTPGLHLTKYLFITSLIRPLAGILQRQRSDKPRPSFAVCAFLERVFASIQHRTFFLGLSAGDSFF